MKKEIPSILCLVELWSAAQGMMMVLPRGSSEAAADGSIIENSNIKLNVHSIARPTEEEEEKKLS